MVSIGDCSGVSVATGLDGAALSDLEMLESVVNVLSSWLLERTEPSWDLLEGAGSSNEISQLDKKQTLNALKRTDAAF